MDRRLGSPEVVWQPCALRNRRWLLHGLIFGAALLVAGARPASAAEFSAGDVFAAIDSASESTGVARSSIDRVVRCETGGTYDPYAKGDHGTSFGAVQLHQGGGELYRFYAAGYADPFNPYEAVQFLAEEINAGRGSAWSCW